MSAERPIGEDDLQAYVDGQLAPERRVVVETHLIANPSLRARVDADIALRADLRHRMAFKAAEPIPAPMRVANIIDARRHRRVRRLGAVAAALAWITLGGGAGWLANGWLAQSGGGPPALGDTAVRDASAAYRTFVVETAHPIEVPAAQEAHLAQWLSRRLGHPVAAPDLSAEGYHLMGGRLLPTDDRPAALFMYDDDQGRRLTLYVTPDAAHVRASPRFETSSDASTYAWSDRDMFFAVTSKADRSRLRTVAEAASHQFASAYPAPDKKL